jgi:uncharacterized protein (DUF952 family)/SAM-dependent methyltransferase
VAGPRYIFHIAEAERWERAETRGRYAPPSIAAEGFIHCSTAGQVMRVANNLFGGRSDVVLLRLDTGSLRAPVRYENLEGGTELFPHVYGPIEVGAVVEVLALSPEADGHFEPPSSEPATQPSTPPHAMGGHPRSEGHRAHHRGDPHQGGEGYWHDFRDAAQWHEVFAAPSRDEWQRPRQVISLMGISPGMTVADIGAGTGYFTEHLSEAVGPEGTAIGLDLEPSRVEFIRQRAEQEGWRNVQAHLVGPDAPTLDASSVDRVLIVNTWHHIAQRAAYAARLREALRPGGAVFVVDYTREAERGPPVDHLVLPEEVAAELEAGGLRPEIIEGTLPDQFVVAGWRPPQD